MKDFINVHKSPELSALACASFIDNRIKEILTSKNCVNIGISGGNTPDILFSVFLSDFKDQPYWDKIKFFWVDERCVPPTHPESNFGNAKKILLDPLNIQKENIFRIFGENEPEEEVKRYTTILENELRYSLSLDICLLGVGNDGHTASIFPPFISLMECKELVATVKNPNSGQDRITTTGRVISNSDTVIFLAHGGSKKIVLDEILNNKRRKCYPAGLVKNFRVGVYWFLDSSAFELADELANNKINGE
jgi:6-phosphogluconolactonase